MTSFMVVVTQESRCIEDCPQGCGDLLLQVQRVHVEPFHLLAEFFQPLLEVEPIVLVCCDSDVAARVQAPSLCLDVCGGRDLAQCCNVDVGAVGERCCHQLV